MYFDRGVGIIQSSWFLSTADLQIDLQLKTHKRVMEEANSSIATLMKRQIEDKVQSKNDAKRTLS